MIEEYQLFKVLGCLITFSSQRMQARTSLKRSITTAPAAADLGIDDAGGDDVGDDDDVLDLPANSSILSTINSSVLGLIPVRLFATFILQGFFKRVKKIVNTWNSPVTLHISHLRIVMVVRKRRQAVLATVGLMLLHLKKSRRSPKTSLLYRSSMMMTTML
jgi:hypothetical protein